MSKEKEKGAVKKRAGNRCEDCGMTNAEHLSYYRSGLHCHRLIPEVGYIACNCFLLCRCCHKARHGTKVFDVRGPYRHHPASLTTPQFMLRLNAEESAILANLKRHFSLKYGRRVGATEVVQEAIRFAEKQTRRK